MRFILKHTPSQQLEIDDRVILRKRHPCGSDTWKVWKLGMDIGLTCEGCGRKVRLSRTDLDRRIRRVLKASASGAAISDVSP